MSNIGHMIVVDLFFSSSLVVIRDIFLVDLFKLIGGENSEESPGKI